MGKFNSCWELGEFTSFFRAFGSSRRRLSIGQSALRVLVILAAPAVVVLIVVAADMEPNPSAEIFFDIKSNHSRGSKRTNGAPRGRRGTCIPLPIPPESL